MGKLKKIPVPFSRRFQDFREIVAPASVWLAALAGILMLLRYDAGKPPCVGWAMPLEHDISAVEAGRLETLVSLHSQVQAGDIVARLDDRPILDRLQASKASIGQLQAELDANCQQLATEQKNHPADGDSDLRRFHVEEERTRLSALALTVAIETDQVAQQRLELDENRKKDLFEHHAISQQDYDNIRLQLDGLRRRIEKNQGLQNQTETAQKQAHERLEAFLQKQPELMQTDELVLPLRKSIAEEEFKIEELKLDRQMLVLQAPVSGQVTRIPCSVGEAVVPGEPILVLTEAGSPGIRPEAAIQVSSAWGRRRSAPAHVVAIGPANVKFALGEILQLQSLRSK